MFINNKKYFSELPRNENLNFSVTLHDKFQFWVQGSGGGILHKLRTKIPKSSMSNSISGVGREGILGKLRTKVPKSSM